MKNVEIRVEGQALDLLPNTSFTLERFNPVFDFGTVQGSRVYPFTVPFSPRNNRIFQYANDPQSVWTPRDYYTEKYADGDLIERGFTFLNKIQSNGFEIAFGQNLGDFFGDLQDVPLNRLPLGSEALPSNLGNMLPEKIINGTLVYCLPTTINSQFYGGALAGFNGRLNDYAANVYTNATPKIPFIGVHWLLKRLGELCGFTVSGEFLEDVSAKNLIIYNTFALDGSPTLLTYANHLPESLTVRSLFLALKLPPFGITSFFDVQTRTITMRYTQSVMNAETRLDYTPKTNPVYVPGTIADRRLELDWDLDGDDGLMKVVPIELQKYTAPIAGTASLFSLKGVFSTLKMDTATGLPAAEQQGITALTGQMDKTFKPRLLFWHGVVGGVPTAKTTHGNMNLSFSGANNLREKFWTKYESWRLATFPVALKTSLNGSNLAQLDFHQRAGQDITIHVKGVDYYVQRISTTLPLENYANLDVWKK